MAASVNPLSLITPGWSSGHAADHTASPVILPGCGADEPAVLASCAWPGKGRDEQWRRGTLGRRLLLAPSHTRTAHRHARRMNSFPWAGVRVSVARATML